MSQMSRPCTTNTQARLYCRLTGPNGTSDTSSINAHRHQCRLHLLCTLPSRYATPSPDVISITVIRYEPDQSEPDLAKVFVRRHRVNDELYVTLTTHKKSILITHRPWSHSYNYVPRNYVLHVVEREQQYVNFDTLELLISSSAYGVYLLSSLPPVRTRRR